MHCSKLLLISLLVLPSAAAFADPDQNVILRIAEEGKYHNQFADHLRYLSKSIGTRLTSSENLDKAYAWTQKKFREFGCTNVHLEQWGEWTVGFQRGPSSGFITSPITMPLNFTTQSWTEGTKGKQKGRAIFAPETMEEFNRVKESLKGAWVVFKTTPPRAPRPRPGQPAVEQTPEEKAAIQAQQDLMKAVDTAGILGKVVPSSNDLVITSGSFRDKTYENHPMDVSVLLAKADHTKLLETMTNGGPVELEFNLNNRFIKGPRKLYNVVAEIKGAKKPDEVVIVGGHLDSWDGPGSEGAADNGTGTCCALEAARILCAVGAKPDRTIRFVLFTGEEQGLLGSTEYVKQHTAELPKISAVFIDDSGSNYESGTYCLASMAPMLQPILDATMKAFPSREMKLRTVEKMPAGGASDHAPFNRVGVPAFFWDKQGITNYTFIHHTQHDTFEYVHIPYMVQASTNEAMAAYITACAPGMMPRDPSVPPVNEPRSGNVLMRLPYISNFFKD